MSGGRAYTSAWAGGGVVLAALVLVVCAAVPVRAGSVVVTASSPDEDDALELLARAEKASRQTPYEGLRFVAAWTETGATTFLLEVKHEPGRGTVVDVVGTSAHKSGVMYERRARTGARGMSETTLRLLAAHYRLVIARSSPVAGRQARVVEARRGDGSIAARFWLDRETGLLLRREIQNRHGRVVRASAFIQLSFASPDRMAESPPAMPQPWSNRLRPAELASLRSQGWTIPRDLPGRLKLVEARRGVVRGRDVVHLSYSDGLSVVSVFVQRGSLATRRLSRWDKTSLDGCCVVYRQHTVPRRIVWAGEEQVYTVVADAPPRVVREVVTALPHERGAAGFWGRMASGFTTLGDWLNPVR